MGDHGKLVKQIKGVLASFVTGTTLDAKVCYNRGKRDWERAILTLIELNIYALEGWVKGHCPGWHMIEPLLQILLGGEIKKKHRKQKKNH